MLPLSEKLKNLMNNFTQEMQSVQDWKLANRSVYSGGELERLTSEKQNTIREKYLKEGTSLAELLQIELNNSRDELRKKRYPHILGTDKAAGELQIREAKDLSVSDEAEMLQGLQSALVLGRYDVISFFVDNFQSEIQKDFLFSTEKIEAINNALLEKVDGKKLVPQVLELSESHQLANEFVKEISGHRTYFPWPYTMEEIKTMPGNVMSAAMQKVDFSMELRGRINPSLG